MSQYARIVIERIPKDRQTAAMPGVDLDQRVESQTPVSGWLDMVDAMQLKFWLSRFRPVLVDADGETILLYAIQYGEWEGEPPPPIPFDERAVAQFPRFDAMARQKLSMAQDAIRKTLRWIDNPTPKDWRPVRKAMEAALK